MRQRRLRTAAAVLSCLISAARGEEVHPSRSVSSGRNDVVYLAPATEPYEALPLGNGQLCVMVRNAPGMNYIFNHGSFFASSEQDNDLISSGEFSLELPESWRAGFVDQRLAIHDAVVITRFKTGDEVHTIRSWMAEGSDLMVVEIESPGAIPELKAALSVWDRAIGSQATAGAAEIALATAGEGGHRATAIAAGAARGEVKASATGPRASLALPASQAKRWTLFVACPVVIGEKLTGDDAAEAARKVVELARSRGVEALWEDHTRYWHDYWTKSGVVMHSDDGLADYVENLYHLQLYWMAACSRGPDAPKFNGGNFLFCKDWRSWGGYYWYQNTRELFWPLPAANHAELMKPLVDLYVRNIPSGRKLAEDLYNAPGADMEETMSRVGNGDKRNTPLCTYHTSGTEAAHQAYQYYKFTRDDQFLRDKVYPLLKETLTFHLSLFGKGDDGLYHIYPTSARESYHWIQDGITDLAAVRATLPILIRESERLGLDADSRGCWKEILDHLPAFPVDDTRDVFIPGTFLDDFPPTPYKRVEELHPIKNERSLASKRNAFNSENVELDPIWPFGLVGLDSPPDLLARGRKTFLQRPFNVWHWGMAWDWSAPAAARLGMAGEVTKCMAQYISHCQEFPSGLPGTPGGAPAEWGKQIGDSCGLDAAGVLAVTVQEMQLQSHGGVIRVFPAWPRGWQSEFALAAEGGFVVSSRTGKDGEIPEIVINSRLGGPCKVINPWAEAVMLRGEGTPRTLAAAREVTFDTRISGDYVLRPVSGRPAPLPIVSERTSGPRWPFHTGPDDSAEAYLKRTESFGMLGIARDGQNPTRNRVRKALAEQAIPHRDK